MGCELEDILDDLKRFRDMINYFLSCKGEPPEGKEIRELLLDIEQKLRETEER